MEWNWGTDGSVWFQPNYYLDALPALTGTALSAFMGTTGSGTDPGAFCMPSNLIKSIHSSEPKKVFCAARQWHEFVTGHARCAKEHVGQSAK